MSIQTAWQATFDFWDDLPIVVEPSSAHLTSDAGLLPLRQFDEQIGLTAQFSQVLEDPRAAEVVRLRFYAGLTVDEAAEAIGVSRRTLLREWEFARAWLLDDLRGQEA